MAEDTPTEKNHSTQPPRLEANFSALVISLASSAVMALGMEPHPQTQKVEKDLNLARFNIDMLILLRTKTEGNLEAPEKDLLDNVIKDLQLKYIQVS